MLTDEYANVTHFDDSEFELRLGIHNWSEYVASYSKLLTRHSSFPYDSNGLFLVDKLSILFRCSYQHPFFNFPNRFVDGNFRNRYSVTDQISLVRLTRHDQTYFRGYSIEFNEIHVGLLNVQKTCCRDIVKLSIGHEFLSTRSIMEIVSTLITIASELDLKHLNYADYEIAYDTSVNLLAKVLTIHYKSNQCSTYVHSAHHSVPIYRMKGKRKSNVYVDSRDKLMATYSEGSKKSTTQAKIYNKSYELTTSQKHYISQIHANHFGQNIPVFRVEMRAKSSAFYADAMFGDKDLVSLLISENLFEHYRLMLGDKLNFRSIKPTGYDKNRNPVFEEIKILNLSEFKVKRFKIKCVNQMKLHDRNVNKFKQLLNSYLDSEIDFRSIRCFVKKRLDGRRICQVELANGIDLCLKRYENPISIDSRKKILKLRRFLTGDMSCVESILFMCWLKLS